MTKYRYLSWRARGQIAKRAESRDHNVADRLMRKFAHHGGAICEIGGDLQTIKIITEHRVLSVYATGSIQQSIAPVKICGRMVEDPHERVANTARWHSECLDLAGNARRSGDKARARNLLELASQHRRMVGA